MKVIISSKIQYVQDHNLFFLISVARINNTNFKNL